MPVNPKSVIRRDVEPTPVDAARSTRMAVLLGPDEGAPNFIMRRFVIDPGGVIPAHLHSDIEHEQVIEKGELVIILDDREHTVRAGDSILIPADTPHRYENRGSEPVSLICVIPLKDPYHTEWLDTPKRQLLPA